MTIIYFWLIMIVLFGLLGGCFGSAGLFFVLGLRLISRVRIIFIVYLQPLLTLILYTHGYNISRWHFAQKISLMYVYFVYTRVYKIIERGKGVDNMRTYEELNRAVLFYCSKHGHMPKYIKRYPDEMTISVLAMDYTELDAKIATDKNGKTRVVFKIDGKVASLKK